MKPGKGKKKKKDMQKEEKTTEEWLVPFTLNCSNNRPENYSYNRPDYTGSFGMFASSTQYNKKINFSSHYKPPD